MRKLRILDAFFADTHDIYRQRGLLQRLQSESMVCRSALCVTRNALIQTHASRPSSQHRDTRKVQTRGQQLSMNRFKTSKFKNTTPKIPKKDVSRGAARERVRCDWVSGVLDSEVKEWCRCIDQLQLPPSSTKHMWSVMHGDMHDHETLDAYEYERRSWCHSRWICYEEAFNTVASGLLELDMRSIWSAPYLIGRRWTKRRKCIE